MIISNPAIGVTLLICDPIRVIRSNSCNKNIKFTACQSLTS